MLVHAMWQFFLVVPNALIIECPVLLIALSYCVILPDSPVTNADSK